MSFVWETSVRRIKFEGGVHHTYPRQQWQFSRDYYIVLFIIIYIIHIYIPFIHFNIVAGGGWSPHIYRVIILSWIKQNLRKSCYLFFFLNANLHWYNILLTIFLWIFLLKEKIKNSLYFLRYGNRWSTII